MFSETITESFILTSEPIIPTDCDVVLRVQLLQLWLFLTITLDVSFKKTHWCIESTYALSGTVCSAMFYQSALPAGRWRIIRRISGPIQPTWWSQRWLEDIYEHVPQFPVVNIKHVGSESKRLVLHESCSDWASEQKHKLLVKCGVNNLKSLAETNFMDFISVFANALPRWDSWQAAATSGSNQSNAPDWIC